ncbi:MAG: autotransporter outer membrane beta-barrel domain-containing protein [Lamprobacter sp.]|uniref:autotransporter outer membrane beta-barrel domain-containing protein n=1 Tax=Lamprobacter sp. TaxID=3100796 RepID=UPI002B25F032|nr:autotransporter outer membrane beta-barrel domain-containing protein [Lamprobacter sp.]MEA3640550.1 autotransporter outer membrane beta-barrel domain-containing protein [Lamprobacter sp.]
MSTQTTSGIRTSRGWAAFWGATGFILAGAAQGESYEFLFDFNQGQGFGEVSLDGPANATYVRLSEAANFLASFEYEGVTWTTTTYSARYPDTIGLNQANDGTWFWDDSGGSSGEQEVISFSESGNLLSFDEGDLGSRVFRVNGDPAGEYVATRGSVPTINPVEVLERIAFTSNTASTAKVIGTACPQVAGSGTQFSNDCTTLVVAAASQVPELESESAVALSAVTAEQATVPLSSSRSSLSTQLQNLSSRLAALRSGATGLSIQGLSAANASDEFFVYGGGAASADGDNTLIFGDERIGVFINGTYSSGDKDETTNEDGFNFNSWGFTAGIDYRFTQDFVVGLAIGYGENDTSIDNSGGSLDTSTFSTSLYGTYFVNEQLYVDGIVTYSSNDYDQKRNINYAIANTPVRQVAKADYDGSQWSAALGGGYQLSSGPWSYGPTVRLEYISASVDGYTEKMSNPGLAGGGWAARLNDLDQESFTSSIGFDVARSVSMDWGVLSPQLNLSWVHEFKDDALSINGVFVEDPNRNRFGVASDRPDSDYFNGRLAVAAQLAGGTSAFVYYNKVFGYKDLDVDTFGAGVRMAF